MTKHQKEILVLLLVVVGIIVNAIFVGDSYIPVMSAVCGISYTALAGMGFPICYPIGIVGIFFYCTLSFQNALWGNLLLYACYYLPMQIYGFISWNKNLQANKKEVVKRCTSKNEILFVSLALALLFVLILLGLYYFKDSHPVLDAITTTLSVAGMYFTVRRAIEQWICWMIVNSLSLIMWLQVALGGAKVFSTLIMWTVYTFMAFYFYFQWKKELKNNTK